MKPTIAVVGAGLAGLSCARSLEKSGHRVLMLDKSRGIGGRVATRRTNDTCFDHGLPAWEIQGPLSKSLIEGLSAAEVISPVPGTTDQFASAVGMTAGTKHLAKGLDLTAPWRLSKLCAEADGWQLIPVEEQNQPTKVQAVVLAVPAPQAVEILENSGCVHTTHSMWLLVDGVRQTPKGSSSVPQYAKYECTWHHRYLLHCATSCSGRRRIRIQ
eukprot:TRINITY_DN67529_c3_g4_i2.p1 TRINITY_DN67529_c3_g4~~TRINITY_DN67529_c3_g4_i2.p1  ORF type:complete len:214 (+),score=22.85 TRINITY_DN67529_c3_g4_i2:47-688(+)